MLRSPIINVMVQAARKTARGLIRDFGEVENLQVSRKGPADFVSEADRRAEQTLFEELSRARPGFSFLMEESGARKGKDPSHCWVVDPLDGTTNFLHGVPQFSISVALERDGVAIAAMVYDPISDEMYVAERGAGAFFNNRRLRVSGRTDMSQALVACGFPFSTRGDPERFRAESGALQPHVAGLRRFGSAALDLAWVAAGRFDAFWERGLSRWDTAAGILLVREAGGIVSDLDGRDKYHETSTLLVANEPLHGPILKLLRDA